MENTEKGILLESGTNELEIIEFGVGQNRFGINVMKVREIILPVPVTKLPHSHPFITGIIQLRGEVLSVVDLAKALGFPPSVTPDQDRFIVAEFNQMKLIFHVHDVSQIYRISWEQIEKPSNLYQGLEANVTGVIKMEEKMILLLDFEKIITEISPSSGLTKSSLAVLGKRERADKAILVAEDSTMLRNLIEDTLAEAGYDRITFFEDGKSAIDYLETLKKEAPDIKSAIQLVITDIEMPQMDGHHLTKRIKDDPELSVLPVIIFSSLITEELRHKGEAVGADAQVSKPDIVNLVKLIDEHIL